MKKFFVLALAAVMMAAPAEAWRGRAAYLPMAHRQGIRIRKGKKTA